MHAKMQKSGKNKKIGQWKDENISKYYRDLIFWFDKKINIVWIYGIARHNEHLPTFKFK